MIRLLWMAAMAAASVLAGYCMGRLSVGGQESGGEQKFQEQQAGFFRNKRQAWEVEAAGQWNVRMDGNAFAAASAVAGEAATRAEEMIPETDADRKQGRTGAGGESLGNLENQTGRIGLTGTAGWISDRVIRGSGGRIRPLRRSGRRRNQQDPEGREWTVGSPVKGWTMSCREGEHPTVVIQPEADRLYAPAGGKIVRLYPMGNAFLFRSEFGTELRLQVGNVGDDLLGRFFRPRVLQNEIVSKGKLLLEFDSEGLAAAGVSPAVTVTVENHSYGTQVHVTACEQAGVGDEILKITERGGLGTLR